MAFSYAQKTAAPLLSTTSAVRGTPFISWELRSASYTFFMGDLTLAEAALAVFI